MARVKLEIPDKVIAKLEIPIRITDINYGNHLGNDALVSILHEARVMWLKKHGYSELNIEGNSIIMSDLAVQYLSESFYGDTLMIELSIGEISTAGFELYYFIYRENDNGKQTIAKAKTGIVFYNYALKKINVIPVAFKELLMNGF